MVLSCMQFSHPRNSRWRGHRIGRESDPSGTNTAQTFYHFIQSEKVATVKDQAEQVIHLGKLVEDAEARLRSEVHDVCLVKTREIVRRLRRASGDKELHPSKQQVIFA